MKGGFIERLSERFTPSSAARHTEPQPAPSYGLDAADIEEQTGRTILSAIAHGRLSDDTFWAWQELRRTRNDAAGVPYVQPEAATATALRHAFTEEGIRTVLAGPALDQELAYLRFRRQLIADRRRRERSRGAAPEGA